MTATVRGGKACPECSVGKCSRSSLFDALARAHCANFEGGPPYEMGYVDDNKIVTRKVFKRLDLSNNFSVWRALASVRPGPYFVKERGF